MSPTVDDFIKRFGGPERINEDEAQRYFDRFASTEPQDSQFDNQTMCCGTTEYLGKLPDQEFQRAAQAAYERASSQQQQSIVMTLRQALQRRGISAAGLDGLLGGGRPEHLSPAQYALAVNFVRQRHPDAMQEVIREQPWFIKAMGSPVVVGALGLVANRLIRARMAPPSTTRSAGRSS